MSHQQVPKEALRHLQPLEGLLWCHPSSHRSSWKDFQAFHCHYLFCMEIRLWPENKSNNQSNHDEDLDKGDLLEVVIKNKGNQLAWPLPKLFKLVWKFFIIFGRSWMLFELYIELLELCHSCYGPPQSGQPLSQPMSVTSVTIENEKIYEWRYTRKIYTKMRYLWLMRLAAMEVEAGCSSRQARRQGITSPQSHLEAKSLLIPCGWEVIDKNRRNKRLPQTRWLWRRSMRMKKKQCFCQDR